MAARTATRKPAATAAGVPSYRKPLTLLERLSSGQRWTVKRENGVPVRLMRWDGKRVNPSCSVSLRLAAGAGGAQKAIREAALTLEALTAERENLTDLLQMSSEARASGKGLQDWLDAIGHANKERNNWKARADSAEAEVARLRNELSAGADGKSVADWLKAIEHAQAQEARWKENYHEAAAERVRLREDVAKIPQLRGEIHQAEGNISRLEGNLREVSARASKFAEELDQLRTVQSELRGILMPAMGIEPGNWASYALTDAAQGVVDIAASRLEYTHKLRGTISEADRTIKERDGQIGRYHGDFNKLRDIIMNALEVPAEEQKNCSLFDGAERLAALVPVNKDLAEKLTAERSANLAHQHARRMGWLMSIGALLLSIPLTLWISGFWSWRAGR